MEFRFQYIAIWKSLLQYGASCSREFRSRFQYIAIWKSFLQNISRFGNRSYRIYRDSEIAPTAKMSGSRIQYIAIWKSLLQHSEFTSPMWVIFRFANDLLSYRILVAITDHFVQRIMTTNAMIMECLLPY